MPECIFCSIADGRMPADRIYEDGSVLAFLDIRPISPGHTLVIAKEHHPDLLAASPRAVLAVAAALPRIARAIVDATGASAFNIGVNNGSAAGQEVSHLHWHIIPRHIDDGLKSWPRGTYAAGEATELAGRIHAALTGGKR